MKQIWFGKKKKEAANVCIGLQFFFTRRRAKEKKHLFFSMEILMRKIQLGLKLETIESWIKSMSESDYLQKGKRRIGRENEEWE